MKRKNKYTKDDFFNLVKERVEQNKNMFTENEIKIIEDNIDVFSKIYLIAIIDAENME